MNPFLKKTITIDWLLVTPVLLIMGIGLVTNFPVENFTIDSLFFKQCLFVALGATIMILGSSIDHTILRGPFISFGLFVLGAVVLIALLLFAPETNGARSWFVFGSFALQPVEGVKLILIIILARYFATRHIHIQHFRYVLSSMCITGILFLLVFKQPDLGSSVILIAIWAGMIFVSGVSKKHILGLLLFATIVSVVAWQFLPEYQKERVLTFAAPLENLQTAGYTAYQSKVAIGSGEMFGKGIGEGTQSKLGFLPLYESDFVFAAFAEEWGFFGILILFFLFGVFGWRLLWHAMRGRTNFETLYIVGVFAFIFSHLLLHTGVNSGLLPVTGITLPFMSYGGSHILVESIAIAIVLSMARNQSPGRFTELHNPSH